MFKLNEISIRNKLILMQVVTSVLVLGIVFAVFVVTDTRAYKERKATSMINFARVIGSNNVSSLIFKDNEAARLSLSELGTVFPDIIYANILDKDGKQFARYIKPGADSLHIPPEIENTGFLYSGNYLFVSNPVIDNNQQIGKVFLELQTTELQEIKQSRFNTAIVLLFVALGFSLIIAIIIQRYISKRLLYVVNTMKEVSETGDYNKAINDDGKDEISILIKVFNDLMQQVRENQQRKDEFIGIASHELKTPLTSIKGYIELLTMLEETQPKKQYLQKALENINKLERLIKDLLDVSKIQSGQLELNLREFDIDVLLNETISSMQMVSTSHQILKEGNLEGTFILADRQRIEQVLINLISNALKYSPGANKIIVSGYKKGSDLIIEIRDFGIGVPQNERLNIFERFYRTKELSIHISGFGLGLYICRDIIQRHNGKIWMEGKEKGSAFYFSLPLSQSNENHTN